nr:Ras GTPase activating protein binding protein 1 [Hymenolepis microstoma]
MVTNGDGAVQNNVLMKMNLKEVSSLAEQFVLQYYTVMNRYPELLHRFYSNESVLIYESQPVTGQVDINTLLTKLNLKDTHVLILTVDALKGHGNSAMVQVCGEQSVASGPYRRFMRSFTLVERGPNSFAVIGDIFRYQDRVYIPEKKQSGNSTEAEGKQTVSKRSAKASSNGVPVDSKSSNRHKPTEPKTEKQLPKEAETDQHPRPTSPKVPAEPAPRKPAESNLHSQVAPFKQEHIEPSTSAQNKPQSQNTSAQQQQVTEQLEKSTSNAPMSYAQRASSNAPSTPPSRAVHLNKTVASEQPVQPPTKVGGSAQQRSVRGGGFNNSASLSSVRPNSQVHPQQAGPSANRESNSEFPDNTHGQVQQVQHGGRGGLGGPRVNMRGGGGNRGVNRGSSGRGGNRGANNSHAALSRQ